MVGWAEPCAPLVPGQPGLAPRLGRGRQVAQERTQGTLSACTQSVAYAVLGNLYSLCVESLTFAPAPSVGGLAPGRPAPHRDLQGHGQLHGPPHLVAHDPLDLVGVAGGDLQEELVVDLEQDAGGGARPGQRVGDVDHRLLDDVGRAALDGGVEGRPLGHLAQPAVVAGQIRQVAAALEFMLQDEQDLLSQLDKNKL